MLYKKKQHTQQKKKHTNNSKHKHKTHNNPRKLIVPCVTSLDQLSAIPRHRSSDINVNTPTLTSYTASPTFPPHPLHSTHNYSPRLVVHPSSNQPLAFDTCLFYPPPSLLATPTRYIPHSPVWSLTLLSPFSSQGVALLTSFYSSLPYFTSPLISIPSLPIPLSFPTFTSPILLYSLSHPFYSHYYSLYSHSLTTTRLLTLPSALLYYFIAALNSHVILY